MKTIGIIGGSTDIATVEYYKIINATVREQLGGLHTGEIIINSMDLARSAHYVRHSLWDEGGAYLATKAQSLERAGADFLLVVSNTWHRASPVFMAGVSIPLLHIADPTAAAIRAQGLSKVILLGTKATMGTPYWAEEFKARGVVVVVPNEAEQTLIDDVIFNELSFWQFRDESRQRYLEIVDRLVREEGAQGVVLGCTEIPLLVRQEDRPGVPMFDTLTLHAKAAALMAVKEDVKVK
ncbi:aspartate racemase [Cordyceps militaris CM01]|uniref:Aspartate racemase n=1 Tax=Cordyceps militaris (strain CM01) TaxID=983644 RepID=G3JKA5_CORMM|nr:aspartate racemase [Cordyceps militaris CM01]EGX91389.1 aspartate racemase [Cordyceps militaris CM01]